MKILSQSNLASDLKDQYLFFDTNFLLALLRNEELLKLIYDFKNFGCSFLSIPSVEFEFLRGANTVDQYNYRAEFIKNLITIYPIERHLSGNDEIKYLFQKIKNDMDYTDFLLCIAAYKFQNSKIITENHSHFPKEILNRDFIITIDYESDIRNYGIYSFSQEKFQKARQNILKKI